MVTSAVVQQLQEISSPQFDIALGESEEGPPVAEVSLANTTAGHSSPDSATDQKETKKMSALGHSANASKGDDGETIMNPLAPTGDVRREVLNTIMRKGLQGNTIAAGAAISLQRSLQELERKRATELMLSGDRVAASPDDKAAETSEADEEKTREKLVALGISIEDEETIAVSQTEEDEVMEAIRLLLIQNRVAQGHLSPADAAKVLQHASLNKVSSRTDLSIGAGDQQTQGGDDDDVATVDAGDVDRRLVGCGPVPPAVLQALTLWKGGLVTNAELLELVKKDAAFVRHSVLLDAENVDKLNEDSAFWGRFAFGERWAEKKSRIASSSPQGNLPGWDLTGVIIKSNDDLRQGECFVVF